MYMNLIKQLNSAPRGVYYIYIYMYDTYILYEFILYASFTLDDF